MNKYTAEPIVCDTGVFMNGELQLVCKHSRNAEIVAEIMNRDEREETADVEPVRNGHWILHERAEEVFGLIIPNFECSECHTLVRPDGKGKRCLDCGAKMG